MGFMDRLFKKAPKTPEPPPPAVNENAAARPPEKIDGPAVPENLHYNPHDLGKRMILPAGLEATAEATRVALDGIMTLAESRFRELHRKESSMPALEDAAEDEKDDVMRLDAESDVWSRITGALNRTNAETDPLRRLDRLKKEITVLRNTNLGKGPEAEVIKLEAVEEIEKRLRM